MVLFILRKLTLQTRMRSHPVGLDVWVLVRPFIYYHTKCVWTVKALTRLRVYAGSPEPFLVANVISTIISWAGSFHDRENLPLKFHDQVWPVVEWLRSLIFRALNHSSCHRCGFKPSPGHMWDKPSSACGWSGDLSWGSPIFAPPYDWLSLKWWNNLDGL